MSRATDGTQIVETLRRVAAGTRDLERYAIGAGIREIKSQVQRQLHLPPGALDGNRPPSHRPRRPVSLDQRRILAAMQQAAARKIAKLSQP